VVTPKVIELPRARLGTSWVGEGEGRPRASSAAGEDDVVPRAYRDGDELRRVHWRSTARYGELMVRREEQRWRNRAMVLLDTRRDAHSGSGVSSSFEFAVSAAASIGVHLARGGMDGQLVTDQGQVTGTGAFEDVLLDALSVMGLSRGDSMAGGLAAIRASGGGLLVVVAGRLSAGVARQLAAARQSGGQAIALLLATSSWTGQTAGNGRNGKDGDRKAGTGLPVYPETAEATGILTRAGWNVVSADAATPLTSAWRLMAGSGMAARAAAASDAPGAAGVAR
jgi:hypothetical protein